MKNPRLLHDHRGTRRSCFQIHVPPARTCRLDVTRYSHQRKRKLFVATLEIDPARIHFDAAKEASVELGLGSHSARFQSPSRLRTRLRLGRSIETVPS